MEKEEFLSKHWNYYLLLETDFINTFRYVTLEKDNAKTYSIEFIKQFLTICSEIDTLLEYITGKKNIYDYFTFIYGDKDYKKIINECAIVIINNSNWEIQPFYSIFDEQTKKYKSSDESWWHLYDKVKHERVGYYQSANLNNVLTSLAALYILEMTFFQINYYMNDSDVSIPLPSSKLFKCKNLFNNYVEDKGCIVVGRYEGDN